MLQISSEIVIEAPVEIVWDLLIRFDDYLRWNPFIPSARGAAVLGTALDVILAPPGLRRSRYRLAITEVDTMRSLAWLGHMGFTGVMDGDHRFDLQPCSLGTVLVQSEKFSGVLVPVMRPWLKRCLLAGFVLLNEALKREAEAVVAEGRSGVSSVSHAATIT
jgi:hypothetical protein